MAVHGLVRHVSRHDGRVWLASVSDERLYEIDPDTAAVVREWEIPSHVEGLRAAGPGALWLGRYGPDEVVRFDLSSGEITGRASFDSQPAFVEAFGSLWVADDGPEGGTLHRLDPETLEESATIPLGHPHGFLAVGEDVLWMTGGVALEDRGPRRDDAGRARRQIMSTSSSDAAAKRRCVHRASTPSS